MISGVKVKDLRIIFDGRGHLMEVLRSDDKEMFSKFGQVYITTAKPGVIKAWHFHKIQTDHIGFVKGQARLALYDARTDSATHGEVQEFVFDENKPVLVKIPPFVYHGFKCTGPDEAYFINVPTELYNYKTPDEFRVDPYENDIPYDWRK